MTDGAHILALAKAGNLAAAIDEGEKVFARGSADGALSMFVGMLCGRRGELERGLVHLRRAASLMPSDMLARVELARMSLAAGHYKQARDIARPEATVATSAGREMLRITAHALRHDAQPDEARIAYESLTKADRADFESWDGLGLACLALGQAASAVAAFRQAAALRGASAIYWVHLATACYASEMYEEGVQAARRAVAQDASSWAGQLELGRCLAKLERPTEALASLAAVRAMMPDDGEALLKIASAEIDLKAFGDAEATLRRAIAIAPDAAEPRVALGALFERINRMADLGTMLDDAAAAGVEPSATALLRARFLKSEGRLGDALAVAQTVPPDDDPVGRAQLIGQLADRLGDTALAFAAFSDANDALAGRENAAQEKAAAYLKQLSKLSEILTPRWYAGWSPPHPLAPRRSPLFIFGFPRSGTTLIDTMLIGHPDTAVLEEEPFIFRLAEALGPVEKLPQLPRSETDSLRTRYFAEVDRVLPDLGGRLIVDKNPLGMGNTLLVHRLFPDARYVFVERHPYDVVLSCFITSARLNNNVATFSSFEGIARLYDEALRYWTICCEVLPIAVHRIRYERLIRDPEAELRPLAAFAGLRWDDRLLAHEANAAGRDYIASPSYAQVTEPIYSHASGRWRRYREHFGPAAEILKPWVERMGYETD